MTSAPQDAAVQAAVVVTRTYRATPEDLWALRALAHTVSLLARCEVEEDWLVLGVGAVRQGWG